MNIATEENIKRKVSASVKDELKKEVKALTEEKQLMKSMKDVLSEKFSDRIPQGL